jgi:hypothetical protein
VLLTIPFVTHDYILGIDVMRRLGIHWRCRFCLSAVTQFSVQFLGLESLSFRWRFLVSNDAVFTNDSMRQQWLFSLLISCVNCEFVSTVYSMRHSSPNNSSRFHVSDMTLFPLSIPYITCHSVFIDDFNVYSDSVFIDHLWISRDIAFLTIPCVSHVSIFAFNLKCPLWIHWCCRFHTSAVTQYYVKISMSTTTLFSVSIYDLGVT